SKTAWSRPPSSTRRNRATPAPTSSATGWAPCDPVAGHAVSPIRKVGRTNRAPTFRIFHDLSTQPVGCATGLTSRVTSDPVGCDLILASRRPSHPAGYAIDLTPHRSATPSTPLGDVDGV